MTAISKVANKASFETGDVPTQAQFADLIDSFQDKLPGMRHINDYTADRGVVMADLDGVYVGSLDFGPIISAALLDIATNAPGTALVLDPLLYPCTRITLQNKSSILGPWGQPWLQLKSGTNDHLIFAEQLSAAAQEIQFVKLVGLKLDGNYGNNSGAFDTIHCDLFSTDNVDPTWIIAWNTIRRSARAGIYYQGRGRTTIAFNEISNSKQYGIMTGNAYDMKFIGNNIDASGENGMHFGSGVSGIYMSGTNEIFFSGTNSGNTIVQTNDTAGFSARRQKGAAIFFNYAIDVYLGDTQIEDTLGDGVYFLRSQDVHLDRLTCRSLGSIGRDWSFTNLSTCGPIDRITKNQAAPYAVEFGIGQDAAAISGQVVVKTSACTTLRSGQYCQAAFGWTDPTGPRVYMLTQVEARTTTYLSDDILDQDIPYMTATVTVTEPVTATTWQSGTTHRFTSSSVSGAIRVGDTMVIAGITGAGAVLNGSRVITAKAATYLEASIAGQTSGASNTTGQAGTAVVTMPQHWVAPFRVLDTVANSVTFPDSTLKWNDVKYVWNSTTMTWAIV